jgi:hypothetical protein
MGPIANTRVLLTAGVLCLLGVPGCGKSGAGGDGATTGRGRPVAPAVTPRAAAPASDARYRWLVRTEGPPPSIAAENRARWTTAWRLPGPRSLIGGEARGPVAGYVAAQAIAAGQTQTVYVSAPHARTVTVRVYRMGWYHGRGGRLVLQSSRLAAVAQPSCLHRSFTGLTECDWHATLSFPIPRALASGVYIVKLHASDGAQSDCLFVVR